MRFEFLQGKIKEIKETKVIKTFKEEKNWQVILKDMTSKEETFYCIIC